jgi:hypothetical protein
MVGYRKSNENVTNFTGFLLSSRGDSRAWSGFEGKNRFHSLITIVSTLIKRNPDKNTVYALNIEWSNKCK